MKTTEDIVNETHRKITTVQPETTAYDAVQAMVANKIGAILVAADKEIIGIWTERDLMRNVLLPDFDLKSSMIKDLMKTGLHSVSHDITVNKLLNSFIEYEERYLLVKKNNRYIGLVALNDAVNEYYQELRSYFSLQFYESPLKSPDKDFAKHVPPRTFADKP